MAVNVPNPGIYQQGLGQHIVQFRDALQRLLNDAAYLNQMGGLAFLQAAQPNGMGLSAADAQIIQNAIGVVTPGNATVIAIQNYLVTTEGLWGGQ